MDSKPPNPRPNRGSSWRGKSSSPHHRGGSSQERGHHGRGSRGSPRPRGSSNLFPNFVPRPKMRPLISVEPTPPRGKLIEVAHRKFLQGDNDETAKITNCEFVASFNWLDDPYWPTILVPGMPPLWAPPSHAHQIDQDSGDFYRDKNASRFPSHPWEPAAVAAVDTHPSGVGSIDIVCCGSTLGNLLRFVRGVGRPFQFLVDAVGDAVHFTRRENKFDEIMQDVKGYGHTFPQAYTTWPSEVAGSVSHQRIVRYTFASYSIMLRFESDGYIDPSVERPPKPNPSNPSTVDDVADLLANSSLSPSSQTLPKHKAPLRVLHGGTAISQDKVFDVKTRGLWRKNLSVQIEEEIPRLWASQTPHLITAFHERGRFPTAHIEIHDTKDELATFERDHAKELTSLAILLRTIVALVKEHKHIEVVHEEGTTLEFRTQVEGSEVVFSEGFTETWQKWLRGGPDSESSRSRELQMDDKGTNSEAQVKGTPADLVDLQDDDEEDFSKCSAGCGYCGIPSLHK